MDTIYDVMILGAGPAGLTAALYAGRSGLNTLLLEQGQDGGQIALTDEIENYPGQLEGESGAALIARMSAQAERFGAVRARDVIRSAELTGTVKTLAGLQNTYRAHAVILASGATPRPIGCKNEEQYVGRGISYCATCDAPLYRGAIVAVIGYQKSEEAEADFLADIAEKVYYIPMYKEPVEVSEKIQLVREVPKEITGGMKADVLVTNANSYPVDCVFILRESVSPKNLVPGLQMDGNHVAVNLQMETNVPGCFACGDIAGRPYQYIKSAGQGNIAALSAVSYLDQKRRGRKSADA